ncbi:hypothetical protein GCM10027422_29070 [Hymenobacter arcticus]
MTDTIVFPAWVRVTKLQSCADAFSPEAIAVGRSFVGYAPLAPAKGRRFELFADQARLRRVLSTSEVRECLSPWIFMTFNSFYLIEVVEAPAEAEELVEEIALAG